MKSVKTEMDIYLSKIEGKKIWKFLIFDIDREKNKQFLIYAQ